MKLPGRSAPPVAPNGEMTLFEHLAELRMRIVRAGLTVMLGSLIVFAFYGTVLDWLTAPYRDLCKVKGPAFCGLDKGETATLNFLDPLEGFAVRVKISFYGGILIALPVILWQLWKFIVPALHKNEKKYAIGFVFSSVVLFACGGAIAFFTLGKALEFLISWAGPGVKPEFQVLAYIRLVTLMIAAFGIGFTIPVLLVFLQLIGLVKPKTLLSAWRYAIVGIFFVAAVITPSGDPYSLLALSVPLTVFYFVAILVGWLLRRNKADATAA